MQLHPAHALRPRAYLPVAAAGFVLCLLTSLGCSFYPLAQRAVERPWSRAGVEPHTVQLGPDAVRYRDGGRGTADGPPVLLLHGFGASAEWQWFRQVEPLARARRVIAPDLLWFGGSTSTLADYSLDHQAAAVLALLDHLDIEQVDVVGLSYGGFVAYRLAQLHPTRVRRAVFVASPGLLMTAPDVDDLRERVGGVALTEVFVPDDADGVQRLVDLAFRRPPRVPRRTAVDVVAHLYTTHRQAQRQLLLALEGSASSAAAPPPALLQPVAVIWGQDDAVFPVTLAERFADVQDARLTVVNAGHAAPIERPREVTRAIRRFLRTTP